jgi:hypothetical protein
MKKLISIILVNMLMGSVSYAANLCDPIYVIDCSTVNSSATGGGIHTSEYGVGGTYITTGIYSGQKITYTASLDAPINGAASQIQFAICGSSVTTVKLIRFGMDATVATTAARLPVLLTSSKTQISGGTALSPPPLIIAHDTKSPIATVSLLNVYTATPTAPVSIGTIGSKLGNRPITATFVVTDQNDVTDFDFGYLDEDYVENTPFILHGPTQCITGTLSGLATVPTYSISVSWTEEYDIKR